MKKIRVMAKLTLIFTELLGWFSKHDKVAKKLLVNLEKDMGVR